MDKGILRGLKMYNHWKKILLALTAFFWNACDNNVTPTGPVVGPDPTSSSTDGQNSSSSVVNPGSSSVDNPTSSSADVSSSSAVQSSSAVTPSSSSIESSNSVASSSSSPVAESSSSWFEEVMPLYGVLKDESCVVKKGESVYQCTDGVTCVESTTDSEPASDDVRSPEVSAKYGVVYTPDVTAKYGVVYIKDKTYKCSDGKVYNEAEFRARYNIIIMDETVVLYGSPCVFDGTCGKDM